MKYLLLAFALVFSLSAFCQLKPVSYADGKQKLNGFSHTPSKALKAKPGILILPAWRGVDDHSRNAAAELAALGYYAFIADIYGEGNYPKDTKEAGQQSGFYKTNFKDYQRRIGAALNELVKSGANADNIVVIGYCFGGTGALEAARGGLPVKGAVAFHGGLARDPARTAMNIEATVLVCHGADDPMVPEVEIQGFQQEMRDSKADWQMIYYADAVHGFTEPSAGNDKSDGVAYNEKAAKRSWEHLLLFLKETLK